MAWAPDYATTAELRDFLKVPDTADDAFLSIAITAASRAIDVHTGRQFGQVSAAEQRRYTAEWDRRRMQWLVTVDDLQDVTALIVEVEAGEITAYTLHPLNAAQKSKPFELVVVDRDSTVKPTGAEGGVAVTALWGWSTVPVAVAEATLLQAARLFARRTSPYGVAGSPELGSEMRLLAKLDPDVAVSLRDYIRWWAAG